MTIAAASDHGLAEPLADPRRPAAIAFADVVGYSALMAADEHATDTRWNALLRDLGYVDRKTFDGRARIFTIEADLVQVTPPLHPAGALPSNTLAPATLGRAREAWMPR